MLNDTPKAIRAISKGNIKDYLKTKSIKPRKLFSKKATSKKIIIENAINQCKAELIGTFSLTKNGRWVFMELIYDKESGYFVCSCPKDTIEVKQVGVAF